MAHGRARRILFRIFYSTSFTIVFLLTVAFACAGPIDVFYQSYRRGRLIDMFMIAGVYILTGLLAGFLYASRIYTNRSGLKDIPKTYIPIDKAELPVKKVWRLIEDCKNRSAVIAYIAKPRSRRVEVEVSYARARIDTLLRPEHSKRYRMFEPQWGTISHPGWSSPAAKETPSLEYSTVVAELTDLIEARAVSLAPVDPDAERDDQGIAIADEYIIEALRRPEEAGMRQYIAQLISLSVLEDNSLTVAFLTLYERARFAPNPLSEDEFNTLMRMFAEVLRAMKTLDISQLDVPEDDSDHDQSLKPQKSPSQTEIARNLGATISTSSLSSSIAGSVRHHTMYDTSPSLAASMPSAPATAVPRISHDSVRSISSSDDLYADAEGSRATAHSPSTTTTQPDSSWTQPTSRPPFFRARSSNHSSRTNQSQGRTRTNDPRQSRFRRAVSRRSIDSTATGGSIRSLRSLRSNGSVIRLNPDFERSQDRIRDGATYVQPYEFTGITADQARRALRHDG